MDFLKQFNISDECIEQIYNNYSEAIIDNFIFNQHNIIKIIEYFKSKQVDDIEWILLENIDIFIKQSDIVINLFEQHPDYINKLNDKTLNLSNLF